MAEHATPPPSGDQPGNGAGTQENKYIRVLELASRRKRTRANLEEDYRRPQYEPARPPATGDDAT